MPRITSPWAGLQNPPQGTGLQAVNSRRQDAYRRHGTSNGKSKKPENVQRSRRSTVLTPSAVSTLPLGTTLSTPFPTTLTLVVIMLSFPVRFYLSLTFTSVLITLSD